MDRQPVSKSLYVWPMGSPTIGRVIVCASLLALGMPLSLFAFEDTFDDGNLDDWTVFDPMAEVKLAAPSTFRIENGTVLMEANPPAADPASPARLFASIDDEIYTDFYCAVDIVDWNDEINQNIIVEACLRVCRSSSVR